MQNFDKTEAKHHDTQLYRIKGGGGVPPPRDEIFLNPALSMTERFIKIFGFHPLYQSYWWGGTRPSAFIL